MIALTRRYSLSAAHVLASRRLSDAENDAVFGKCANPSGHGHNYGIEVTVTGEVDPETGQILPIDELDAAFDGAVRDVLAYRMLNDLDAFAERVPTAENIAIAVHDLLAPAIAAADVELQRVRVVETSRNTFDYGDLP